MRRKIELFINGILADLSDQGLILFNYSLTDLQKPTAVKNSFSKQITLPGTPQNDAIFGHIIRTDRVTTTGAFNAGQRTPFTIYDAQGQIVESGYLRLDSVTRKGAVVTGYKVSLFGGLGSFFYALSYDAAGNKRTLADLDYLGTGSPTELDFTISASTVAAAWAARTNHAHTDPISSKWHVLNFAPALNGIPSGDFSADKGIATAALIGLPDEVTEDGKVYRSNNGKVLVNLAKAYDEWAVKDLRCYLQRPVLNIRAFLEAVMRPENNGGYTVDYPNFPTILSDMLWKTLPTLPSLGDFKKIEGSELAHFAANVAQHSSGATQVGTITVTGSTIPDNAQTVINAPLGLSFMLPSAVPAAYLDLLTPSAKQNYGGDNRSWQMRDMVVFTQLVGYGADNTMISASPVKVYATTDRYTPSSAATAAGFTPVYASAGYEADVIAVENLGHVSGSYRYTLPEKTYHVEGVGITSYRLYAKAYYFDSHSWVTRGGTSGREQHHYQLDSVTGSSACPALFYYYGTIYQTTSAQGTCSLRSIAVSYTTTSSLRSGAHITKDILLQSKYTPAEYVLSLAKMFGMYFICDPAEKKVTVLSRSDFFNTGLDTIDLTGRIDTSKDITITPQVFAAKWYTMKQEMAEGAWAEEYQKVYGVQTGIQRIDTGYDFDASDVELMDGTVFRMAASVLDSGPYYNWLLVGGQYRPSPFIDPGHTFTIWAVSDGAGGEFPVPGLPSNVVINYLNEYGHEGSDVEYAAKLDLRTADGSGVDGVDILCLCNSADYHPYYKLTDDTAAMTAMNGNKPCWNLDPGTAEGISIPNFHRFNDYGETWRAELSLDFGLPREWKMPIVHISENEDGEETVSIYARFWRSYLRDLLDKDTKVMKCRVNLEGLQVGPQLLRRFFWYENSLWVLNKITNYSLTTYDPAECEFVQVRNIENYTNGQIWTW